MRLTVDGLRAGYGPVEALHGVSFRVEPGEIVALLGANGAGKSTALRAISGLVRHTSGEIRLDGESLAGVPPHEIVARGLVQVPEGRRLFATLTVRENLDLGAFTRTDAAGVEESRRLVHRLFPVLLSREKQLAGTLSGGEQQMLAIGRALLSGPRILLLDEPSLGLSPILVKSILATLREINQAGVTVLLVEQNARAALRLAHRAYVLVTGTVALEGRAKDLLDDPAVRRAYLGG
ncbi:MAG: ABC transporter ATP-binding protein [Holophagales bacterium]|nr:ABC transporter ATP-binding protein [Holophagales bacterium]